MRAQIAQLIIDCQVARMAVLLVASYALLIVSMAVDLVTGVHKARMLGIARTSTGYKKTCDKAAKYFLPMLCLTCIDVTASPIIHIPAFTMLMGAFNIFCEWRSVFESTHKKQEIKDAAETVRIAIKNKDDIVAMFGELVNQVNEKQKKDESK